jgi:hypothetical protein
MKFSEFREYLVGVTTGDKIVPTDKVLYFFIHKAIKATALQTKPLKLVSNDIRDKVLFIIEDGYFIRVPNEIKDEQSEIDIDDDLILAVAYYTASMFVHRDNKKKYKEDYHLQVSEYNWNRYYTSLNMCKEDCHD